MSLEYDSIIKENQRRRDLLFAPYNPFTGEGSPIERVKVCFLANNEQCSFYVPKEMYKDYGGLIDMLNTEGSVEDVLKKTNQPCTPDVVNAFIKSFSENRFYYDFEFWAYACVKIQDKKSKVSIPFILNQPQRKTLVELLDMLFNGIPIRMIILKARQWGGSTLIQVFMAWMQVIRKKNWHSAIIADVDDQARNIRGMYSRVAKDYPEAVGRITFAPYEQSQKNRIIIERNCIVGVGSAQKPDNLRSFDFAMLHMSEVGLWKSTPQKSAEDLVQSVRATVPTVPDSMIVLESTAKGVGNFFHIEWQAAANGESSYRPVFVGWHEIELYQKEITAANYSRFVKFVMTNEYAKFLWGLGATLEGIKWYFDTKKGENYDDWRMKSEFPSTAEEAFQSTGRRVFAQDYVLSARKSCIKPEFIGDISGKATKGKEAFIDITFKAEDKGLLRIWSMPDNSIEVSNRYVVVVDIGGRTEKADYSVIKVFDRYWMGEGGKPEVVATWRGHLDQDLIAWKAAQISKMYCNALLVVENNSLDTNDSEGEHHLTVLDEIVKFYNRLYARTEPDKVRQNIPIKYGFHTNRQTKPMVIDELNGVLREGAYIERDLRACDEMDTYEIKKDGTYGAVDGCKDDLVMTTAIGVWICFKFLPLPKPIVKGSNTVSKRIISEASI